MPVTQLFCPCVGARVPLDHYESGACGGWRKGMKMPLGWVIGVVRGALRDRLHADGRLTATRVLTCAREVLIRDFLDVFFDPRSANSTQWGTNNHEFIAANSPTGGYVKVSFGGPDSALPAARLLGVEMAGELDHIVSDFSAIHDYKMHAMTAQSFKASGKPDETTAGQMNIYRLALEQVCESARGKVQELLAFHGSMAPASEKLYCWRCKSSSACPPWMPQVQPILSEEQIAQIKPGGGEFTVAEIITEYEGFFKRQADGVALEDNLRMVPLIGRTMFGKKKCTEYCQPGVKFECDRLEGIYAL